MFTFHVREAIEEDTVEQNEINVSFTASKNSLERNENLLDILLSSTKFRSKYRRVPRNFTQTIVVWREISLELSPISAKYRCLSNNRTRKISSKNRSKRNFALYHQISFALLLHNTVRDTRKANY